MTDTRGQATGVLSAEIASVVSEESSASGRDPSPLPGLIPTTSQDPKRAAFRVG